VKRQRRGVALMLAVWLVAVLGALAAAIVSATRGSATLTLNLKAESQARRAAESGVVMATTGVERTLRALADSGGRRAYLNSLERSGEGGDGVALGEERFAFTYVDVNSRLDVNWATGEQLTRLFELFTSPSEAAIAAKGVRAKIAGTGRAEPLRSLEDLPRLAGVPRELAEKAAPYLTVDGDGRINAASASDTVLSVAAGDLEHEPSRVLIISRGWVGGHKLTHEIQAVYGIESNSLVLVRWRERDL